MKKVKFFASYCSENQICQNIKSSWGKGKDTYKDILITEDNDYEYAVVLNRATANKFLPSDRIIGLSHEPRRTVGLNPENIQYINQNVSRYYLSNSEGLPDNFISGFTFVCPSEYGNSEFINYTHENKMSMILSMSRFMPGHEMRYQILERILRSDLDIHFYAEGLNKIYSDPRIKEFNWGLFNIPYEKYQTQIVIENIIDDFWATEKLTNCVIKGTLPVYYGSKKMYEEFYPENPFPMLGENPDLNFEIIKEVYSSQEKKEGIAERAKNKLYQEMNLLEFLHQKFK